MRTYVISWAVLACLVKHSASQLENWPKHQISTSICTWTQPRAALVQDTIYLDGGAIKWTPGYDDGTNGTTGDDGNFGGRVLSYNLSEPFSPGDNVTGILLKKDINKLIGGTGTTSGIFQNFIDGALLANDYEFFLYGGMSLQTTKASDAPDKDDALLYAVDQYGAEKTAFKAGWDATRKLSDGVTPYIAFGGAANAPSEQKAWYFSGMTAPNLGPIISNGGDDTRPVNVSDRLIMVDMETQGDEVWTNTSLPGNVKGRANPEVVWVPVGEEGILVVLGGVTHPEWTGQKSHKSDDEEASEEESPEFMQKIDVYDIANNKWYQQQTEDGPGTRTRGCTVVATAPDSSSFNIYYYGGYDGIHATEDFKDDVWVLSLPSFTWIKINEGTSFHARAGHKCFTPYPDQMMVFGGYISLAGTAPSCLDGGPVVLFNISSGEWLDSYDPKKYSNYSVPEKVAEAIGGDSSGNANKTEPASGWDTSALGKVFETSYNTSKIKTYWPYTPASSSDRPNYTGDEGDNDDDDDGGGGGLPSWVAPVLGVVLGLMFITGLLVVFCLWRRRKIFRRGHSEDGTEDAGNRIISWMKGQTSEKAPTLATSEESPASPEMLEAARVANTTTPSGRESSLAAANTGDDAAVAAVAPAGAANAAHTTHAVPAEMDDTQLVELADTSAPAELHDTGLTPVDIIQKHTRLSQRNRTGTTNSPSSFSFVGGSVDHASTVSRSSGAGASTADPTTNTRVTSDVSGLSKPEHVRQLSEGTVSIESALQGDAPRDESAAASDIESSAKAPVSPPSVGDSGGEDYISARSVVSPLRKSVFRESEEDMGKHE